LTDHRHLLEVLLAEIRATGARQAEELGQDGRHAIEVPGPPRTLEAEGGTLRGDERARQDWKPRVDLADRRGKNQIAPRRVQERRVVLEHARVRSEVRCVAELEWVDEN
jgi:hypothetical protein